jgi:stearoyl-CoA desaturase (delta-9 desaturase)
MADLWLRRARSRESGRTLHLKPDILSGIIAFHLLALLAGVPWLFSWSGLAWTVGGLYLFGTLGQGSPISWVAAHRMHHQHSDQPGDPHSPRYSFLWSHMGWFLVYDSALYDFSSYERYTRDLFRDRFYKWLERPRVWGTVHLAQWTAYLGTGGLIGALGTRSLSGGLQLGFSWLVWGVFVRTIAVWHITWSVNSITHLWGYRTFDTPDDSRNNWLVALFSNGEGWHNNHHAEPRCAAHGRDSWELDVSYWTIRALARLDLASDLVQPRHRLPGDRSKELRAAA